MMQKVGTVTRLKSDWDEDGRRSEEARRPVRDNSDEVWEESIPLPREEQSWKKAPDRKLSTLQQKHRNAAFGEAKYESASLPMNYSRAETPISVEDAMAVLMNVASVKKLKVAYKHSHRGAVLAGLSAFVGGMLAGPLGIAVGGAVGGLIGCLISKEFKPVPQILMELPAAEKQKLCAEVKAIVKNLQWKDAAHLIRLVMANPIVRDKVLGVLTNYFAKKL